MKITRYMGAFAVIAMLAACSTDDEQGTNTAANEVKIAATIGGNSIFTRSNPVGSETEQTSFNEGDAISVTTEGKTVIYTKNEAGQWANANDYLVWMGNAQTFEACYPGNSTNSISVGHIEADQSKKENIALSDYMTCTENVTKTPDTKKLTLDFERQTARVIVKVSAFGNEFEGLKPTLSAVEVYSKLKVPAEAGDTYSAIKAYKTTDENGSSVFYALVSPGAANNTQNFLKLTVTYNDGEGTATKTKELYVTGIPALSKATSYTYDVKIGKDKVTIGSVSVTDWGEGDDITGGDASIILPPEEIIKQALAAGETKITLNLAKDFTDFSKITDALKNAGAGTIDLTLKGCENIAGFTSVACLRSIHLPDIGIIETDAFGNCPNLESVDAPNAEWIWNYAFNHCHRLESVYAPKVALIEQEAFSSCVNLRIVELGNIGYAEDGIFKGTDTGNISLILSADQKEMKEDGGRWVPTDTGYKGNRNFLGYTFDSVELRQ